jgi:hypothetical protein
MKGSRTCPLQMYSEHEENPSSRINNFPCGFTARRQFCRIAIEAALSQSCRIALGR